VSDLFYGQFKSKLVCSECQSISISFDVFSTVSMPIPQPPKIIKFYYVPYDPEESGSVNYDCTITIRVTESVWKFREVIAEYLKIPFDSFLIAKVASGKVSAFFNVNHKVQDIADESGKMICYQISKQVDRPIQMPPVEKCSNSDSNHGLGDDWVKMVIQVKYPEKSSYSYSSYYTNYKSFPVPRVLWLKKSWTLQQVHYSFFLFFRQVVKNWFELTVNKHLQQPLKLTRNRGEDQEG